ncbi:NAD-dependent epimerase/dehydratase family protein [Telmatobacter sp. DSM 110680]|uniref:NAD-dependent epimerase/dehydratase family protein n=1 Tax=Telmatobacter sp. DSM 110680 TaxID=3036704 RepID=A0AAU7DDE3_9BACT
MKILVTGGAGFIGSNLVDRLVRDQYGHVSVFDDFSRGRLENLSQTGKAIRIVYGNILDFERLRAEMVGTEVVFHFAALSNVLDCVNNPAAAIRTNVEGTRQVLEAARQTGVRRVVLASSREVYGEAANLPVLESSPLNPKNIYGASKVAAEKVCAEYAACGLELTILRLSNVYGTRDRGRVIPLFIERALRAEPITIYGKNKLLDLVWIENLLDVLTRAVQLPCPTRPMNIGCGKGTRLVELAARVCALTDQTSSIHIAEEREPEVEHFVAEVTAARRHFSLHCPDDPLEYLPYVVEDFRTRM